PRGVVQITTEALANKQADWDNFELELIDQGAEDIISENEGVTIYTNPEGLPRLKAFLDQQAIVTELAEIQQVAKEKLVINSEEDRLRLEKFVELLDDCEDISDYYTNAEWD
ncbi:hypothetical protein EOM71_01555, partial [Candidatus Falkowbacteria bacterium]|nr:hypothetical protein [Candidatus Falkowbacteria bacterium]